MKPGQLLKERVCTFSNAGERREVELPHFRPGTNLHIINLGHKNQTDDDARMIVLMEMIRMTRRMLEVLVLDT